MLSAESISASERVRHLFPAVFRVPFAIIAFLLQMHRGHVCSLAVRVPRCSTFEACDSSLPRQRRSDSSKSGPGRRCTFHRRKRTLLNRILTENHRKRIAVIENEFGEIGIDQALVVNADEEIFEMNMGASAARFAAISFAFSGT
jgi:hypothetical protein